MLRNFVATGTTIINGAFFKESIVIGQGLLPVFGGQNAVLPIKVYEGQVDAGNTLFLIGAEDAFMVYAIKAFELGPILTQLFGQVFQHGDAHIATDGEENDVAQMGTGVAIFFNNMLEAFYQGVAGSDNVADDQGAPIDNAQLFIFDIKTGNELTVKNTLAGQEAHIIDGDAGTVAAFLQGIVEAATQNGQDVGGGNKPLFVEEIQGGFGGIAHPIIIFKAHHLR